MAGEAGQGAAASEAAASGAQAASERAAGARAFVDHLVSPETMVDRVGSVVLVAILSLALWLVVVAVTGRVEAALHRSMVGAPATQRKRYQRALTGVSLIANVLKWVIIIGGVLAALVALGLGPTLLPVLAGAGVIGLAIGFGAQALIRDLIAGLIVLLEGQYGVGDFIQVGGVTGQVQSVGLRVTILRDLAGRTHFLPNGGITVVAVHEDPWFEFIVDLLLARGDAAPRASELVAAAADSLAAEHGKVFAVRGRPEVQQVAIGTSVRLPVATFLEHEWLAKEELVQRLTPELAAAGIELFAGRPIRVYPDYVEVSAAAAPAAVKGDEFDEVP